MFTVLTAKLVGGLIGRDDGRQQGASPIAQEGLQCVEEDLRSEVPLPADVIDDEDLRVADLLVVPLLLVFVLPLVHIGILQVEEGGEVAGIPEAQKCLEKDDAHRRLAGAVRSVDVQTPAGADVVLDVFLLAIGPDLLLGGSVRSSQEEPSELLIVQRDAVVGQIPIEDPLFGTVTLEWSGVAILIDPHELLVALAGDALRRARWHARIVGLEACGFVILEDSNPRWVRR